MTQSPMQQIDGDADMMRAALALTALSTFEINSTLAGMFADKDTRDLALKLAAEEGKRFDARAR